MVSICRTAEKTAGIVSDLQGIYTRLPIVTDASGHRPSAWRRVALRAALLAEDVWLMGLQVALHSISSYPVWP